ncbi:MAG: molybdopterin-dependent oxidoreductase [Candidatus Obscuribacterales bacterium]|nr:molybdopterin-dependent oxidoreductase [Candidatus Obscuribacterales bacterium]
MTEEEMADEQITDGQITKDQCSAAEPEANAVQAVEEKLVPPEHIQKKIFVMIKDRLVEKSPEIVLIPRKRIRRASRRDFLVYGVGMAAVAAGFKWLLPDDSDGDKGFGLYKKKFLHSVNDFDDAVAQSLFSQNKMVPTYSKSQITELPNNYAGQTPDGAYLDKWKLNLTGLASGHDLSLTVDQLRNDFSHHEIINRLVCVEGWSAIAWWGGLKFADLLRKYPPRPDTKWIQLTSSVNLDADGNSDPYFVSIDLPSALHSQTLLATHHNGALLEVEHGAPLRLMAPMKLGLKNIKAITSIAYTPIEPDDYWNRDGYSYYDGI